MVDVVVRVSVVHDVVSQPDPPIACARSSAPSVLTVSRERCNLRCLDGSEFVISRLIFFLIEAFLVDGSTGRFWQHVWYSDGQRCVESSS